MRRCLRGWFGAEAGEVVAVVQTMMLAGLPYIALRDAMAEGLTVLFVTVPSGRPAAAQR